MKTSTKIRIIKAILPIVRVLGDVRFWMFVAVVVGECL